MRWSTAKQNSVVVL